MDGLAGMSTEKGRRKMRKIAGLIVGIMIISALMSISPYKVQCADFKEQLRKEMAKQIDKIFTFKNKNKNREWKFISIEVEGKKRAFLITPVDDISDKEKNKLRGKDLYLHWGEVKK